VSASNISFSPIYVFVCVATDQVSGAARFSRRVSSAGGLLFTLGGGARLSTHKPERAREEH
jgi:hypothetical protein